jgi:L-ascorbate metabolism protein UlaG (beta-lactamase superfamily)
MKHIFSLLFLVPIIAFSQDIIPANGGDIKITPILHGSLVIEYDGLVFYVDPYGGATSFEGQPSPNYVLITDIHGDHYNPETLGVIDLENALLIVPQAVKDKLTTEQQEKTLVLNNGDVEQDYFDGMFMVTALPMYNLPETDDSRHPKGRGNGYVLELGGKRIYISGDTEDIPEMRALKDIDVAFVCMNLPYTMDVDQAASAVVEFKPKIVYPYHYRGSDGLSDVEQFKKLVNSSAKKVDVRLRPWYPEK